MPHPWFVDDLPLSQAACKYATAHHGDQRRDSDFASFVLHPLEVAFLLRNRGYGDEVVAAGLLHDVVEDTTASIADLRERFGERVASLVAALSEDPSIPDPRERKRALRAQVARAEPEAQAIYAADKVAKARELRAQLTREPGRATDAKIQDRLEHYRLSLELLAAVVPEVAFVKQLRFELWALEELPPYART